jgi:uncharacterized RDD family membrane protein YckC
MSTVTDYYPREAPQPPRAGLWRRALAICFDFIIVCLPFQIAAAVLFAASDGKFQETMGLRMVQCDLVPASEVARFSEKGLVPPPPSDANYANSCTISLFGFPTAKVLVIGRHTVERTGTSTVTKDFHVAYPLSTDGNLAKAHSIDWMPQSALLIYWFATLTFFGQTIGMRVMKARLVMLDHVASRSVPFLRVFYRNFLAGLPMVPIIVVGVYGALFGDIPFGLLVGSTSIAFLAGVWVFRDLVFKWDPFFDRYAGTAVIRTDTAIQESQPA